MTTHINVLHYYLSIGDYGPFSLLVGIVLSEQNSPYMGNLCVYPGKYCIARMFAGIKYSIPYLWFFVVGSHYTLQPGVRQFIAETQHIQPLHPVEHVPHSILPPKQPTDEFKGEFEFSSEGIQAIQAARHRFLSQNLGEPTQVLANVGDVVLLHQKLAHRGNTVQCVMGLYCTSTVLVVVNFLHIACCS